MYAHRGVEGPKDAIGTFPPPWAEIRENSEGMPETGERNAQCKTPLSFLLRWDHGHDKHELGQSPIKYRRMEGRWRRCRLYVVENAGALGRCQSAFHSGS